MLKEPQVGNNSSYYLPIFHHWGSFEWLSDCMLEGRVFEYLNSKLMI